MEPSRTRLWLNTIMQSFISARANVNAIEKPFYGPWNKLLHFLFPPDSAFEIVPSRSPPNAHRGSADPAALLLVAYNSSPVLFVEVWPASSLGDDSGREGADARMRRRIRDGAAGAELLVLHGVCAFGTKLAFYRYDARSGVMTPPEIPRDAGGADDATTAPRDWWAFDILEQEGADKLREIVGEIEWLCAPVPA